MRTESELRASGAELFCRSVLSVAVGTWAIRHPDLTVAQILRRSRPMMRGGKPIQM